MNILHATNSLTPVLQWLDRHSVIALDTETTGLDPYGNNDRLCGISLYSGDDDTGTYVPFRHGQGHNLPLSELTALIVYLSRRVNEGNLRLLTWNGKFDVHMLHADGFEIPTESGAVLDYMIGAHLMNENEKSFGLKELSDKYLSDQSSLDEHDLKEKIDSQFGRQGEKAWKGLIWKLDARDVEPYAITDVVLTWNMGQMLDTALSDWGLTDLFIELSDYSMLITRMEAGGIQLDVPLIGEHMDGAAPLLKETTASLLDVAAKTIPTRDASEETSPTIQKIVRDPLTFTPSPIQLKFVFDWDQTDKQFLESLAPDHPDYGVAQMVMDHRVLSKMNGTYYDAYLSLIDKDGVLRPNYNLIGTVNGRLSCNRPNIQNVPRYTEKRRVKDVFTPKDPEFRSLIEIDYAQAELRIACHFAREHRLGDILRSGGDPHGETATRMGVSRHVGKTLNFAVIYGAGIRALTKLLKCSPEEARDYLNGYNDLYPGFRRLADAAEQLARQQGYIQMPTGRYRHFINPVTRRPYFTKHGYPVETRKAMNSLIQGSASEMLRVGMQRIDRTIRKEGIDARLVFQVHDSVMIEANDAEIERLLPLLRKDLTDFPFNPAPDIDAKAGKRWGQLSHIDI